jgi:hypothetical protein
MFNSIHFYSKDKAERLSALDPDTPRVWVSVLPPGMHSNIVSVYPNAILRVAFDDTFEEVANIPSPLPDALPNRQPMVIGEDVWPDYHHAKTIFDFLMQWHQDERSVELCTHCEGGISRSAAVAQFASLLFSIPVEIVERDTSGANRRLLRLFQKVVQGGPPIIGDIPSDIPKTRKEVYGGWSW